MNLAEIGNLVRQRRLALGLSQARLAKLGGRSRATINQLENGSLADLGAAKLATPLDLIGVRPARIWQHLARWSADLRSPRRIWARTR